MKRKNKSEQDIILETPVLYAVQRYGERYRSMYSNLDEGHLILDRVSITIGDISFEKEDIQWIGRKKNSNFLRLDVIIGKYWHQMSLTIGDEDALEKVYKWIPGKLKQSRYTNRPEVRTITAVEGHVSSQNLHGIFEKHQEVGLYVTPLWMLVLHKGAVFQKHYIDDIHDIRCSKHPMDKDERMQLLTFEVEEEAFAYAIKDRSLVTRLSDATKSGIDSAAMRKKKQEN